VSHIWFISRKIIGSTTEGQLNTRRHKENKIILKRYLVVFFIRLFIVYRSFEDRNNTEAVVRERDTCKRRHHTKALKTAKNTRCLQLDLAIAEKNIGWGNTPSNTGLQSFTIKTENWRNRILSQNWSKEEVEVATTKNNQLHLLIDTPNIKIWREPSDVAELTHIWPSLASERTLSR